MCKKLIFRNESVSNKFMASKILRELQCQSSRYIMSEYNIQAHKNFYFLQQYRENISNKNNVFHLRNKYVWWQNVQFINIRRSQLFTDDDDRALCTHNNTRTQSAIYVLKCNQNNPAATQTHTFSKSSGYFLCLFLYVCTSVNSSTMMCTKIYV